MNSKYSNVSYCLMAIGCTFYYYYFIILLYPMSYFVCVHLVYRPLLNTLYLHIFIFHFLLFLLTIYYVCVRCVIFFCVWKWPIQILVFFVFFLVHMLLNWNATKSMDDIKLNANHVFVYVGSERNSIRML